MTEAYFSAVSRWRGADAVRSARPVFENFTSGEFARRPGVCATILPTIESILRDLASPDGQSASLIERLEADLATSPDPPQGGCL